MTVYAVDYAWKGPTVVLVSGDGANVDERVELAGTTFKPRQEFINQRLRPGDVVLMEMGGAGDLFAAGAYEAVRHGDGGVLRLPSYHLPRLRGEFELGNGRDAEVILEAQLVYPEIFYPFQSIDIAIVELRRLMRGYAAATEELKKLRQRLGKVQDDLAFLRGLTVEVPGRYVDLVKKTGELDAPVFEVAERTKENWKRLIQSHLKQIPFAEPLLAITGSGPAIVGETIAQIFDIRRFADFPNLFSYSGVSLTADGRVQRKRRAEGGGMNFRPELRQALLLFASFVTPKMTRGERSPWLDLLDARIVDELQKEQTRDESHAFRRAARLVAKTYLFYVWEVWRAHFGLATPRPVWFVRAAAVVGI